ncbi:hypothetical protein [Cerasicoccus maritimus]|uniref:hypothetical protein n=1 Tax=Cerasicoccus maritimus TaxID=490089 RepID=UPI0028527E91|nr:hypothetical protein [Cerasicoccus maritimus]
MRLLLLSCLALLLFTDCGADDQERELTGDEITDEVVVPILAAAGFKLPPGSQALHYYYVPPIDPAFLAKFKIPEQQTAALLGELAQKENQDVDLLGSLPEKVDWWISDGEDALIERRYDSDGGMVQVVVTASGGERFLYVGEVTF